MRVCNDVRVCTENKMDCIFLAAQSYTPRWVVRFNIWEQTDPGNCPFVLAARRLDGNHSHHLVLAWMCGSDAA